MAGQRVVKTLFVVSFVPGLTAWRLRDRNRIPGVRDQEPGGERHVPPNLEAHPMRVVENLSRRIQRKAQNIWQAVLKMSTGCGGVSLSKSAFRCELRKRWNGKPRLLVQLWEN
jgi:hypothetical protein